ncbi:MAG: GNAT family N-acetyltransferase [Leptospirillia bacterium]
MSRLGIRPMTEGDIPKVVWLESVALEQGRPDETWKKELADPVHHTLVSVDAVGHVFGFIAFTLAGDEVSINQFAVIPEGRRRGIGTRLLTAALDVARTAGMRDCFLDVRRANRAARKLYEKLSFTLHGERKGYYRAPPDDALIYRYSL